MIIKSLGFSLTELLHIVRQSPPCVLRTVLNFPESMWITIINVFALLGQISNKIFNTAFMSVLLIWAIISSTFAILSIWLLTVHVGWKKNSSPHSLNFLLAFQNRDLQKVISNRLLYQEVFFFLFNYMTCDSQIWRSLVKQPFVFGPHQIYRHIIRDWCQPNLHNCKQGM